MPRFEFQREVPFPRPEVFDIVADVERYPEFLPGWRAARIIDRADGVLTVEQELGTPGFSWRFRSRATLERPERITIETREHPFRYLHERWRFTSTGGGGTRVVLEVDYELASVLLRHLAGRLFDRGLRDTFHAFRARIGALLG